MLQRLGLATIPLLLLTAAAAQADIASVFAPGGKTMTLGIEARMLPRWDGSSRFIVLPLPVFDVRVRGKPEHFRNAREGLGIGLIDLGRFRAGIVGKVKLPRRQDEDPALAGLGDIGWAVEIGAFAEVWWVPWLRARAELRQGFGGHHGVAADLMLDAVAPVTNKLTLSAGPRVAFASDAATAPYFSITPAQAAGSGLPVFDAKGGLQSYGAGGQGRYALTPNTALHAFVEYKRLTADAAASPIVSLRGTANQWIVGAGISYSFDFKF